MSSVCVCGGGYIQLVGFVQQWLKCICNVKIKRAIKRINKKNSNEKRINTFDFFK